MSMPSEKHLDYDELLKAVVDASDLPDGLREHLDHCPQCQEQLQRTTQRLESIGRIAARLAPEPSRSVRVHGRRQARRPLGGGRMKSFMAMAAVAMLVVLVSVWSRHFFAPSGSDQVGQLIADVNRLVENPLPAGYSSLAAVADPLPTADPAADPTAFIVPEVGPPGAGDIPENERITG